MTNHLFVFCIFLSSFIYLSHEFRRKPVEISEFRKMCNVPKCSIPCPGAAAPPVCPKNATNCHTGCACMYDCQHNNYICYMTKHCEVRKRYLGQGRRRTTKSMKKSKRNAKTTVQKSRSV